MSLPQSSSVQPRIVESLANDSEWTCGACEPLDKHQDGTLFAIDAPSPPPLPSSSSPLSLGVSLSSQSYQQLLCIAGQYRGDKTKHVTCYDPLADRWFTRSSLPLYYDSSHNSIWHMTYYNNRIFIMGFDHQIRAYDISLDKWYMIKIPPELQLDRLKLVATSSHGLIAISDDMKRIYSITDIIPLQVPFGVSSSVVVPSSNGSMSSMSLIASLWSSHSSSSSSSSAAYSSSSSQQSSLPLSVEYLQCTIAPLPSWSWSPRAPAAAAPAVVSSSATTSDPSSVALPTASSSTSSTPTTASRDDDYDDVCHSVYPMSMYNNTVIICLANIRRRNNGNGTNGNIIHDVLWMDTIHAPGIWRYGPTLGYHPYRSIVVADNDDAISVME